MDTAGGGPLTCAAHISNLHAEDKAGLVSFSFGFLHQIHREVASFGAMFMQDLNRCFTRMAPLSFKCVQAACKV